MSETFLIVQDDGAFYDRYWEVIRVCSSLDKAQAELSHLITQDFMQNVSKWQYDSPYHIQIWKLDGERVDAPDDCSNDMTIAQIAKTNPIVQAELDRRKKLAQDKEKLLQEHQARQTKLSMRRELDIKLLNGELTKQEYRAKVDELHL